MSSPHILIVYGTSYGQTAKIAQRMADLLIERGCVVSLRNGDALPRDFSLGTVDGVIVGASVIRGRHQRGVRRFVRINRDALGSRPSAFFSVSGSAARRDEQGCVEAERCVRDFLRETQWHPAITQTIAGAIAYTRYGPFLRWMLKQIAKKNGGPTDTSRDHEFTDWAQVDRFADEFLEEISVAQLVSS